MYCAKCGVELQKGVEKCPLCGLRAFHPDIKEEPEPGPFPRFAEGEGSVSNSGVMFIVTVVFLIPLIICLIADISISGGVSWSGYAAGGIVLLYAVFCLPHWFRHPKSEIFFPVAAALALCLALYVCLHTGGRWFLPFAFPVGGALALIIETMIVLLRFAVGPWPHRALYIVGGASVALGLLCVLVEFLIKVTFGVRMIWWSLYPLTALALLGLMLIVTGACRPLRESLHKKLFI